MFDKHTSINISINIFQARWWALFITRNRPASGTMLDIIKPQTLQGINYVFCYLIEI